MSVVAVCTYFILFSSSECCLSCVRLAQLLDKKGVVVDGADEESKGESKDGSASPLGKRKRDSLGLQEEEEDSSRASKRARSDASSGGSSSSSEAGAGSGAGFGDDA